MRALWLVATVSVLIALGGCAHPGPKFAWAIPASTPGPAAARFATPRPPFVDPADDAFHAQALDAELAVTPRATVMRYRRIRPEAYYWLDVNAAAWQLAYRSDDSHGRAQVNIATVLVPPHPEPRLLAYQVAYDGLTRRCAPSREILDGSMVEQWLIDKALARGWVVVVADYEGPEALFGAGRNAGRGVLDGIRAAQRFLPDEVIAEDTPTVLWGYSGGAYASLWAAELAADYAPSIDIVGVAAGGPPANLASTAEHLDGGVFAGIYFAAIIGISRAYARFDTDALLNAKGRAMFADLGASCLGQELAWVQDPLLSGYSFANIADYVTVDDLLAVPAIKKILAENRLGQQGFDAPLLYYQAWFDPIVPRDDARGLARDYCRHGMPVRLDYAIGEHFSAAVTHAADAVDYLAARFAGQPPLDECSDIVQPGS